MSAQHETRLSTRRSLSVYLIVLAWSVLVFWFGVWFGSLERPVSPPAEKASNRAPQPVRRQPQLEFHTELARPNPDSSQSPTLGEANTPETPVPAAVEQAEAAGPSSQPPQSVPARTFFTVQVAAVRSEAEARHEVLRLSARGHRGRVIRPAPGELYFRVWVGEFDSEEEAEKMEATLKQAGFSTYLREGDSPNSQ